MREGTMPSRVMREVRRNVRATTNRAIRLERVLEVSLEKPALIIS